MVIATTDNRTSADVNTSQTLRDILKANSINYQQANIMLDGATLSSADLDKTLDDLGADNNSTCAVTIKIQNAH